MYAVSWQSFMRRDTKQALWMPSDLPFSTVHDQVDGMTIGKHLLLCRVLKGAFHATCRPLLPRYTAAWNVQAVLKYLESSVSSTYFLLTQISHLQACNTAGINYTFLFRRPSSTATRFSPEDVVFLPAALAKQLRQGKALKKFFFHTIQRSVPYRCSSSMSPWLSHSGLGVLPYITTNDILKAVDYSLGSVFRKFCYCPVNDPAFGTVNHDQYLPAIHELLAHAQFHPSKPSASYMYIIDVRDICACCFWYALHVQASCRCLELGQTSLICSTSLSSYNSMQSLHDLSYWEMLAYSLCYFSFSVFSWECWSTLLYQ